MKRLRLGINIDHVATVRNARGSLHPDPVRAAHLVAAAGGDQITAHLREDRRHIRDRDMKRLMSESALPINMEIAATDDMLRIALDLQPAAFCIVPERREELTTEGGLDVVGQMDHLRDFLAALKSSHGRIGLFLDADRHQLDAAREIGADAVEIHTGSYSNAGAELREHELRKIETAAAHGVDIGLEMHAGHGLNYENVGAIARIAQIEELNIGHYLIGEAIFVGLEQAVRRMRQVIDSARNPSRNPSRDTTS